MPKDSLRTPRLLEPLSAALVGAGSFFFLAALSGLGPFGLADKAVWRWAQPGQSQALAGTAVRVQGPVLSSVGRHQRLSEQVAWLRKQGAGAIILEAWFDEAPQAEARALTEELRNKFQTLPGSARQAALKALSSTASSLDEDARLASSLGALQPILLSYATRRGSELELPMALQKQGYEVTLRGRRQTLAPRRAERLPYPGLLAAVARAGAVSLDEAQRQGVPAAVELKGRWYNSLGLEAARMALGVPLEGLRYRWRKGTLSSLELKGVRYPLDPEGRLRMPEALPELPQLELDALQRDVQSGNKLKGKAVFFRPWPQALSDAGAFDAQERLFAAVVERDVLVPLPAISQWAYWVLAWAIAVLGLAWAPAWVAAALWALPLAWLLRGFSEEPQALAQPLALAVSALALGLGWRMQIVRRRKALAEQRFHGRVSAGQLLNWQRRLPGTAATLFGTYVVMHPSQLAHEPAFEAWLRAHDAFVDPELGPGRLGLFIPEKERDAWAAQAVLDLSQAMPLAALAAVPGPVSFNLVSRLGAHYWRLGGSPVDEAVALADQARPGQFLLLERDYAPWHGKLKIQLTGAVFGAKGSPHKVLNVLS